MAIQMTTTTVGNQHSSNNDQNQFDAGQQQQQSQNTTRHNAPSFSDILTLVPTITSLSAEGKAFMMKIKEKLNDNLSGPSNVEISINTLNRPAETIYFASGGYAITMTFAETVQVNGDVPPTHIIPEVIDSLMLVAPDLAPNILNHIVVPVEDYDRADKYALFIRNVFICKTNPEVAGMSAETLRSCDWYLDASPALYKKYNEAVSPNKVQARDDIGFTVNIKQKKQNVQFYPGMDAPENYEMKPMGTVTAYTEFIEVPAENGRPRFLPLVHITGINTTIPKEELLTLFLPFASEMFIYRGLWKTPYSKLNKSEINIGNLVLTNENKVYNIEQPIQVGQFFADFCTNPLLVIDITEGKPMIPGLEKYAQRKQNSVAAIANNFYDFLNDTMTDRSKMPVPVVECFSELIGTLVNGTDLEDSRWSDFLQAVKLNPHEWSSCQELLTRLISPKFRIQKQQELNHGNIRVNYTNHICVLNRDFIGEMHSRISGILKSVQSSVQNQNGHVNVANFVNIANSYFTGNYTGFSDSAQNYNSNYGYFNNR